MCNVKVTFDDEEVREWWYEDRRKACESDLYACDSSWKVPTVGHLGQVTTVTKVTFRDARRVTASTETSDTSTLWLNESEEGPHGGWPMFKNHFRWHMNWFSVAMGVLNDLRHLPSCFPAIFCPLLRVHWTIYWMYLRLDIKKGK
jgi:hypothetical protein